MGVTDDAAGAFEDGAGRHGKHGVGISRERRRHLDPKGAATGVMRAVNGPIADVWEHWSQGRPVYDPAGILAAVLLVHAEWDVDVPLAAAQNYFLALRNARYRRWVEIGEGTHMVLLERQRLQAFQAIRGFLTEREPVSTEVR